MSRESFANFGVACSILWMRRPVTYLVSSKARWSPVSPSITTSTRSYALSDIGCANTLLPH